MPTSRPFFLEQYCQFLMDVKPASLLDIGCGFGKFGFLAREYLDVWGNEEYDPLGFGRTRIDAIDYFSPYIIGIQRVIYDHIYSGNALTLLPELTTYDMIVCVDVLEHFTKEDGLKLLNIISDKSKYAWVVTPTIVSEQGSIYGNDKETHVAQWEEAELGKFGDVMKAGTSSYLLYMSSNDKSGT